MRTFDYVKVPGSVVNSKGPSFQIRSVHPDASVKYVIAEIYDIGLTEEITNFLNDKERSKSRSKAV